MSQSGKFAQQIRNQAKRDNPNPVQVGEVINLEPFTVSYQGLELSKANGDRIYVNNLILDENKTFTKANKITVSQGTVTENHTDIINDITDWLTAVHKRFIIEVGDFVAVQKLGNNTYIILEKVQEIE